MFLRRSLLYIALMLAQGAVWMPEARADVVHDNEIINTPTTWLAADGDHIVQGSVQVYDSLTIEAGCTVYFAGGANLRVFGSLEADGGALGILFSPAAPFLWWAGIGFDPGSTGTLRDCTVEYAIHGSAAGVQVQNAAVSIEDCLLRGNYYGIRVIGGAGPTISGCQITQGNTGILYEQVDGLNLTQANSITGQNTAIVLDGCSNASIDNQFIGTNIGPEGAISVRNSGSFHLGAGNIISGSTYPLTIDADSYPDLASAGSIPLSGNTNDAIQVLGGNTVGSVAWQDLGVPYAVAGTPWIAFGGSLVIADGVTVEFASAQSIRVWGNLQALGTAAGITFTRHGSGVMWSGLLFESGSTGSLSNCLIQYMQLSGAAGVRMQSANVSLQDCTFRFGPYGVLVQDAAQWSISGCSFVQNSIGVSFQGVAAAELLAANVFQQNTTAIQMQACSSPNVANQFFANNGNGISVLQSGEFTVGGGNTFTGNEWPICMDTASYPSAATGPNIPQSGNTYDDVLRVLGGDSQGNTLWRDLDADYVVTGEVQVLASDMLTIEGGCHAKFKSGTTIRVWGSLEVPGGPLGTELSAHEVGETWRGLQFESGSMGMLQSCTIRDARFGPSAAVSCTGSAQVSLQGCALVGNFYGVKALSGAHPTLSDAVLASNSRGLWADGAAATFVRSSIVLNEYEGVHLQGASTLTLGTSLAEWNEIRGNDTVHSNTQFVNGSEDVEARFVYWGTTDEAAIEARIEHEPDDPGLGRVTFNPWIDSSHQTVYGSPFADVTPLALLQPTSASGAAWGDFDGDGDPDLYVTGTGPNKLFENLGATFIDVTPAALADPSEGLEAQWIDANDDGRLDLALTNFDGSVKLFTNHGEGNWSETVLTAKTCWSIRFADPDLDHDLDYARTENVDYVRIDRNDGASYIEEVGIPMDEPRGLAWADYDDDGDPDLALGGSDGGEAILQVQRNYTPENSSLTFAAILTHSEPNTNLYSTVNWIDFDSDGDLDLFAAGWEGDNVLYCNVNGTLALDCAAAVLRQSSRSMSATWGDYDNDGLWDLFVTDEDSTNSLYRNLGSLQFGRVSDPTIDQAGAGDTAGAAWADYDGDGDLDLFVASASGDNKLLRNDSLGGNHWFQVDLRGSLSNSFGHGSKIRVYAGATAQLHEVGTGSGWLGCNSITAEFGLGASTTVDSVVVAWTGGDEIRYGPFGADQRVTLEETSATSVERPDGPTRVSLAPGYPNPFGVSTQFSFVLPRESHVSLKVYDSAGRLVRTLCDRLMVKGRHQLGWDGSDERSRDVSSGSYYLRLQADGVVRTQRIVRIR